MTHQEYQQMKEKEIEVFEQRLMGIIELEIDACDPSAPGVLDTLSDNRKLLADPILLRKAAERFHELFWDNDEVTQLEHDAADQAMVETARSAPSTSTGFSIVRDGRVIELTKDEIKAFGLAMQRDEVSGALEDWLETLDPDDAEESAIMKAMEDGRCRDKVLGAFDSPLATKMLLEADDAEMDTWQHLVDRVIRPVVEKVVNGAGHDEA